MSDINNLISNYKRVRQKTINIANMFDQEDQLDQSMKDASPIIWHLGHTSWFFDNFVLKAYDKDYKKVPEKYYFFFNSYYQLAGKMLSRNRRGSDITLSLNEVSKYRNSIDDKILTFLSSKQEIKNDTLKKIVLGLNHEQQHQELMIMDTKNLLFKKKKNILKKKQKKSKTKV